MALASPRTCSRSCARPATLWSNISRTLALFAEWTYKPYVDDCVARAQGSEVPRRVPGAGQEARRPLRHAYAATRSPPFCDDVKLYVFIAKAAANLYRDKSLDVRGVAHKVQAMLDAYIQAHGIDPKIPPIEILDPNFAAEVSRKKSDRAKAAEMENALRHHISISFEKDPAKFKSLSERLEGILASHHEDWKEISRQLQSLIDEALAAYRGLRRITVSTRILKLRFSASYGCATGARPGCGTCRACCGDRSTPEPGRAVSGFWDNFVGQEEARRRIFQQLDGSNLFHFPSWTRSPQIAWGLRGLTVQDWPMNETINIDDLTFSIKRSARRKTSG